MSRSRLPAVVSCVLCVFSACSGEKAAEQTDVAAALNAIAAPSSAKPATVASLAETVPNSLLDLDKVDFSNQSVGAAGYEMTVVSARYGKGDRTIQLTITDAPAGGPALAAANAWAMGNFERTTANGFQRTAMVDGYRGYEEFDTRRDRATVSAFIANRFVFNVRGTGISMEDMRRAVAEFGLRRLGGLAE